ncbi:MAG: DsrE family protein [Xanthomonadales bacterium]|nr:DsrE family protein [Xanthomonadales bacterium]
MQKRLNINGRVLSLCQPPSSYLSSQSAQSWCKQRLEAGVQPPVVWFLQDAVYHVLRPQAETGRQTDVYEAWKTLKKQGVKLAVCQSSCARRLPPGSLDNDIFELSTLTQWAAELIQQAEARTEAIYCIVDEPALNIRFLREKIDPVLSLLALEVPVRLVFTAAVVDHLLDDKYWRKWRMLPETEELISLFLCTDDLMPEYRHSLNERGDIQFLSALEFSEITEKSCCVYV